MSLLRVAFERADNVAQIVVLCAGCYASVVDQLEPSDRHWATPIEGAVYCEFCLGEAREAALR